MAESSFYGDTPNYATDYPTQNDGNTNPPDGNTVAPSSFYPNGGIYSELDQSDAVLAAMQALEAQTETNATNAATSATNAATSATNAATSAANAAAAVQAAAGTATPLVDGTAAVGTSTKWAHEDHRHPTDTTRADAAATTAALALKADKTYVDTQDALKADKTYVDTQDALKAPLASPAFTGTPTAPTASAGTTTAQIATTAFAGTEIANKSVRYDTAQSLTDAQKGQARTNVYAAPFDALAYSGMQVNGNMEVSQERGTSAVTTGSYVVDGWAVAVSGAAISAQQVADAPDGHPASLKVSVTSADTSPASTDLACIFHAIEGYRTSRLALGTSSAASIAIGFWVKANRPGNYSVSIRNGAANRSYVTTFAVTASATWQYVTLTIPGDVTGTWATTNSTGLTFAITLMSGSTYTTASSSIWISGNYVAVAGATNGTASTTDYMQITGVTLLPGIELPSAARARFVMRPYDQEWTLCRRYYRTIQSGVGVAYASTVARFNIPHEGMRAAPTASASGPMVITDVFASNFLQSAASVAIESNTPDTGQYDFTNYTGLTAQRVYLILNGSASLQLDARL